MGKSGKCAVRGCNGRVFVKYYHLHPNGDRTRKRVCDTCKTITWTIEVPRDKYKRMRKLVVCLQNGVKEFMKK